MFIGILFTSFGETQVTIFCGVIFPAFMLSKLIVSLFLESEWQPVDRILPFILSPKFMVSSPE